jgi:hypothetical protein
MARGDRIEVLVDAGGGAARAYEVAATRIGRRVEVRTSRTTIEVTEVTRRGTPVRTAWFMASRVLGVIEHPADAARPRADEHPLEPGRGLPES